MRRRLASTSSNSFSKETLSVGEIPFLLFPSLPSLLVAGCSAVFCLSTTVLLVAFAAECQKSLVSIRVAIVPLFVVLNAAKPNLRNVLIAVR